MMRFLVLAAPVIFILLALIAPPKFRPYERLRERNVRR